MTEDNLNLPIATPSPKCARDKGVVIGLFPASLAEGEKFIKAHVRFFDGDLFHPILNALIYRGDELEIGGRKVVREKGEEFWIVSFTAEKDETNGLAHSETPNVLSLP